MCAAYTRAQGDGYQTHIKCISEQQKYGGKNFVVREAKGEVKQNEWTEQVGVCHGH